jgi:hypothetical protein
MRVRTRSQINEIPRSLLFWFWMLAMCGALYAQTERTITIRMLDSKTGQPITTSEFQVWTGTSLTSAQTSGVPPHWIKPDKDGAGEMALPPSASVITVTVHAQYGAAGWGYVNCDRLKDRGPFREHWYSISEILASGVTAPNYCGKLKAVAKPGEFIFFVRPMTFLEKIHE